MMIDSLKSINHKGTRSNYTKKKSYKVALERIKINNFLLLLFIL